MLISVLAFSRDFPGLIKFQNNFGKSQQNAEYQVNGPRIVHFWTVGYQSKAKGFLS